MYRELFEEVGLSKKDVRILVSTRNWLRYKLPKRLVRWDTKPVCIGQKQKWFCCSYCAMTLISICSAAARRSSTVGAG